MERSTTAADSVDGLETGSNPHFRGPGGPHGRKHRLAKVRVADPNPGFCSVVASQARFLSLTRRTSRRHSRFSMSIWRVHGTSPTWNQNA